MTLNIFCPLFEHGTNTFWFVVNAYKLLIAHTNYVWLVFGVLLGWIVLVRKKDDEREESHVFRWLPVLYVALIVAIVIAAELISACYKQTRLHQTMGFLFEDEWMAFLGIGVAALYLRFIGPHVERLLDKLTGKSRLRKDSQSDMRTIEAEIPRRPREFDPKRFFIRGRR